MSSSNYISVTNVNASSVGSNVQQEALEQAAAARERRASNWASQAQDNTQSAKAPNDINVSISPYRPRLIDTMDIIEISKIKSEAAADSFESQGVKQGATVETPVTPAYYHRRLGSADNGAWQRQDNDQGVTSYNNIRTRIHQPGFGLNDGAPTADTYVSEIDSKAKGTNTQLQDLKQNALLKDTDDPHYPSCSPVHPDGDASNVGDQIQASKQKVSSQNRIDIDEIIGGKFCPPPRPLDPSATNINSDADGENVQVQSAAQEAITRARSFSGADASNRLLQGSTNGQDVQSSNVLNMNIDDIRNTSQMAIADMINSAARASNVQDQSGTQLSESAWLGAAANTGTQTQGSGQTVGSGNWINIRM